MLIVGCTGGLTIAWESREQHCSLQRTVGSFARSLQSQPDLALVIKTALRITATSHCRVRIGETAQPDWEC